MNIPSTHPPRSQVEQYFFGSPQCISEKILFIKREARLADYRAHLTDSTEFGSVWHGITGTIRGETVSIIATGLGPSMVGDCAYALNRPGALCLYTGTCGSLDPGLQIGSYILAEQAICGDGFSSLLGFAPFSSLAADEAVLSSLAAAFRIAGVPYQALATFTTASVVAEQEPAFWAAVPAYCQSIEMSCAAFYAACLRSQKKPAAYFWVTDLPLHGKSFYDPLSPADQQNKHHAYDNAIALDIAILTAL